MNFFDDEEQERLEQEEQERLVRETQERKARFLNYFLRMERKEQNTEEQEIDEQEREQLNYLDYLDRVQHLEFLDHECIGREQRRLDRLVEIADQVVGHTSSPPIVYRPENYNNLPAVSLPAVSTPAASLPAASLPAVSLPAASLPAASLPAASLPAASLPAASPSVNQNYSGNINRRRNRSLISDLEVSSRDLFEDLFTTDSNDVINIPCPEPSGLDIESKNVLIMCQICYSNQISTVLFPCMHACLCDTCSYKLSKTSNICPICRSGLVSIFKIYISTMNPTGILSSSMSSSSSSSMSSSSSSNVSSNEPPKKKVKLNTEDTEDTENTEDTNAES